MPSLLRSLNYSNVVATLALFVALGGTSYAVVSLPRDSVGHRQVRAGAVRSSEVKDGSLRTSDLSSQARTSLRGVKGNPGPAGPQGVPGTPAIRYFAAVQDNGEAVRGNAKGFGSKGLGSGRYDLTFEQPVTGCAFTATIGSTDANPPPTGRIVVYDEGGRVAVSTFDDAGNPKPLPFHVIVAC